MIKCTGDDWIGKQCPHEAIWRNQYGVECCEHHKLLINAFTWETRNERKWEKIKPERSKIGTLTQNKEEK